MISMDIVTAIVVFIMIWWLVFFLALPFWRHQPPLNIEKGHDIGAPDKLHLAKHLGVVTLLSIVLLIIFLFVRHYHLISLHGT